MADRFLTPPAIARKLGVKVERVRGWIVRGELDAINVSDGHQPRYRVSPAALEAFMAGRSVSPSPAPKRRRKPSRAYY